MKSKSGTNIDDDLKIYFKEVGVPPMVICDVSREKIKGDLFLIWNVAGFQINELEKDTSATNQVEQYIKILKDGSRKDLQIRYSYLILWDYNIERRAIIISDIDNNNTNM